MECMKNKPIDHSDTLGYLKKIEGQIRGVGKMVEDNRYCVDILTQLHSIVGAISNVEDKILKRHLVNCVVAACRSKAAKERQTKLEEVLELFSKFKR